MPDWEPGLEIKSRMKYQFLVSVRDSAGLSHSAKARPWLGTSTREAPGDEGLLEPSSQLPPLSMPWLLDGKAGSLRSARTRRQRGNTKLRNMKSHEEQDPAWTKAEKGIWTAEHETGIPGTG